MKPSQIVNLLLWAWRAMVASTLLLWALNTYGPVADKTNGQNEALAAIIVMVVLCVATLYRLVRMSLFLPATHFPPKETMLAGVGCMLWYYLISEQALTLVLVPLLQLGAMGQILMLFLPLGMENYVRGKAYMETSFVWRGYFGTPNSTLFKEVYEYARAEDTTVQTLTEFYDNLGHLKPPFHEWIEGRKPKKVSKPDPRPSSSSTNQRHVEDFAPCVLWLGRGTALTIGIFHLTAFWTLSHGLASRIGIALGACLAYYRIQSDRDRFFPQRVRTYHFAGAIFATVIANIALTSPIVGRQQQEILLVIWAIIEVVLLACRGLDEFFQWDDLDEEWQTYFGKHVLVFASLRAYARKTCATFEEIIHQWESQHPQTSNTFEVWLRDRVES